MERRIWLLSWPEFREALEDTDVVLLPVGVNEAHGNHLPLGTDFLIPEWIAEKIAEDLNALIAPPIRYGVVSSLSGYWGSLTLKKETFESLIYEVLVELHANGFDKVIIINGHGGGGHMDAIKSAMKRAWLEQGVRSAVINWWELGYDIAKEVFGTPGGHAGTDETAMIMAVDHSLVKGEVDKEEVYQYRKGISVMPAPGSILTYEPETEVKIPPLNKVEEYANKLIELIKEEIKKILEGWERQEVYL